MSSFTRSVRELIEAHESVEREVYYDLENSGLIAPEALEAMTEVYRGRGYGHPSITNKPGWEAYEALFTSAEYIAKSIGADSPERLIFTHSGTEANNLAIVGYALAHKNRGRKIIVSSVEHLSVIFPANKLEEHGFQVVQVPVDEYGFVDPELIGSLVDSNTILVSVQTVNHEIGTVQDIRAIAEMVKDANPDTVIHTDAADAYTKLPIDVEKMKVDMLTLSSHKVLGPKGAGALYVREGVKLERIIHGPLSTQQHWPGVENVPAIYGFYKAAEAALKRFDENVAHMKKLRDTLIKGILEEIPHTKLNGPEGDMRAPDNVNISFLYVEGEALTVDLSLNGIYVSSGSACTSRILEPSHVLLAIGREYEEAHGSILFKVSRLHTMEDVEYTLKVLPKSVERLRMISPIKPDRR